MDDQQLIETAEEARKNAHAPYSNYFVGAAVVDENGDVHRGCNVENAAYPEGNCAEANAIGAMVAAGGKKISVIAAVGGSWAFIITFGIVYNAARISLSEQARELASLRV